MGLVWDAGGGRAKREEAFLLFATKPEVGAYLSVEQQHRAMGYKRSPINNRPVLFILRVESDGLGDARNY